LGLREILALYKAQSQVGSCLVGLLNIGQPRLINRLDALEKTTMSGHHHVELGAVHHRVFDRLS
jgi:hypothetical protein